MSNKISLQCIERSMSSTYYIRLIRWSLGKQQKQLFHRQSPEKNLMKFSYVVDLIKFYNVSKFHRISFSRLIIIMGKKDKLWYGA